MLSQRRDGEAAVDARIQAMLRKKSDYMRGIVENNDSLQAVATTLSHEGPLSELLDKQKLQEYRDTVKRLALTNVAHQRQVEAYLRGLENIQNVAAADEDQVLDYTKILKESMTTAFAQLEQESIQAEQDPMYTEVAKTLNEPKEGAGDDDDEIAVMTTQATLKCPLTSMLMENPWKSKVCGHVYEKDAIIQHLKKDHRKRCPVTGCSNVGMTQAQLEEDRKTLQLIRRQKIRDERSRQALSQNAIDMDDDDE